MVNSRRHSHQTHAKKEQQRMMANPYTCEVQLDELSPDHAIIDFAFISEENFVLVVLLASSGK
ncbi:hypothetical protein TELCIR_23542, partial [Teladorsagia circumcincta]